MGLNRVINQFALGPVQSYIADILALPVKVLVKGSQSSIDIKAGAEIREAGSVGITSSAISDSTGKAASILFSIGYAQALATSTVDVGANVIITAGTSVNITSEANAKAELETETARDLPLPLPGVAEFAVSLAVTRAESVSHTTVAAGASVTAGTIVNIRALGEVESAASSSAGMFTSGKAGLSFSAEFSKADIVTTVNGSVTGTQTGIGTAGIGTAGGSGNVVDLEFDPTETDPTKPGYIDFANNLIFVGQNALESEDTVVYHNRGGNSIGGLTDGVTYFIIKPEDNLATLNVDESSGYIQLATTEKEAIQKSALSLHPGLPATSIETTGFKGTDVDAAKGEFTIHGIGRAFGEAQSVTYHQNTPNELVDPEIPGLVDGQTYYVIPETSETNLDGNSNFVRSQTFKLALTPAQAKAGIAVDIGGLSSTSGQNYRFTANHVLESGFSNFGITSALSATDNAESGAGMGTDHVPNEDADSTFDFQSTLFDRLLTGLTKKYADNASSSGSEAGGLTVAGALSFTFADHDVHTNIGSTAVLKSNADMDVAATITEVFQLNAESVTQPTPGGPPNSVSVAALVGLYENTAQTVVESGAKLDALRTMRITSEVTYPFVTRPDEFLPTSIGEITDRLVKDGPSAVTDYLDGSLGLKTKLFNTWARSTAKSDQVSVAGSVNFTKLDNISETTVKSGARLNQDAAFQSAGNRQAVDIEAVTQLQILNVTGVFEFGFPTVEDVLGKKFSATVSPVGSSGERGGFGGALFISLLDNKTHATVESGVLIQTSDGGKLVVKAEELIFEFSGTQAGGSAGKLAVGGSFAYMQQSSDTLALINSGAGITGGEVQVEANGSETQINWVGGIVKGKAIGVGASVAINKIGRNTRAIVGDFDAALNPLLVPTAPKVNFTINGDVSVKAGNKGSLWAFGVAGAVVSSAPQPPTPEEERATAEREARQDDALKSNSNNIGLMFDDDYAPPPPAGQPPAKNATTGVGIAAAVGFSFITDDVRAAAVNATITANSLKIEAENAIGLAGAFSLSNLDAKTFAFVHDSTLTLNAASGKALTVSAKRTGNLFSLAAGAGGAVANDAQSGISVAGSVSVNKMTGATETSVENTLATANGGTDISASDSSVITSIGGGFALSFARGNTGAATAISAGVAGAVNYITSTIEARISGSRVQGTGDVSVAAVGSEKINAY